MAATAKTILIGGKPYEVPELTIKQMRRTTKLGLRMVAMSGNLDTEAAADAFFDATVELVQVWLNDPKLTAEFLEENLTQSELQEITAAINPVLVASGVKPAPGEG